MQQVDGSLHPLPVCEVKERVRDGFAVPAFEDVFGREDKRFHFQQVLKHKQQAIDTFVIMRPRSSWYRIS